MQGKNIERLVLVIAVMLAVAAIPAAANDSPLRSELEVVQADSNGFVVLLSLTNTSDQDVFILSYETPLNGLERSLFQIQRDGEAVPYTGRLVMRIGPLPENWIRVSAGETIQMKVDLTTAYDMTQAGYYTVGYGAMQHVISGVAEHMLPVFDTVGQKAASFETPAAMISSTQLTVQYEGAAAVFRLEQYPESVDDQHEKHTFIGFTTAQRNAVLAAIDCACANVTCACNYCSCPSSWYTTWFSSNCVYDYFVCGSFCRAKNHLCPGNITFRYQAYSYPCDPGVIAYVYQNRPNEIWLCGDFFVYTYFQCHAITHEVFHWNTVATAEDWGYGESFCKDLARNYHPYYSATNADSYAYAADYCP